MKLLHIDAGITGPASVSRQISAAVVATLTAAHPALEVTHRDLDAEPVQHLGNHGLPGLAENEILKAFIDSDILVIGAPMDNFGIASQLKAWFDHVLVAGKTFRYTPEGPVGLAGGKTVIIASARGGVYEAGSAMAAFDFQEPYLKTVLRFIGIENVVFIRAEGVAISPDHRARAVESALAVAAALDPGLARALAA